MNPFRLIRELFDELRGFVADVKATRRQWREQFGAGQESGESKQLPPANGKQTRRERAAQE